MHVAARRFRPLKRTLRTAIILNRVSSVYIARIAGCALPSAVKEPTMRTGLIVLGIVMLNCSGANAADWQPVGGHIMTPWAAQVDAAKPLAEYPRPQMVRKDWVNLNGLWDYAITAADAGQPEKFDGKIL